MLLLSPQMRNLRLREAKRLRSWEGPGRDLNVDLCPSHEAWPVASTGSWEWLALTWLSSRTPGFQMFPHIFQPRHETQHGASSSHSLSLLASCLQWRGSQPASWGLAPSSGESSNLCVCCLQGGNRGGLRMMLTNS